MGHGWLWELKGTLNLSQMKALSDARFHAGKLLVRKRSQLQKGWVTVIGVVKLPTSWDDWPTEGREDVVHVVAPLGKRKAMVTVKKQDMALSCYQGFVALLMTENISSPYTTTRKVWPYACGRAPVFTEVLADVISFVFREFRVGEMFGIPKLRIAFSFHEESENVPEPLDDGNARNDGRWNCSQVDISDISKFSEHIPLCDYITHCQGAEDEARCSYEGHCGPGYISIGEGCYRFLQFDERIPWAQANVECQNTGGYLASLNTPQEWHDVTHVHEEHPRLVEIIPEFLFGLRQTLSNMLYIYTQELMWADSSIAYYSDHEEKLHDRQMCGRMVLNDTKARLDKACWFIDPYSLAWALCEVDTKKTTDTKKTKEVAGIRLSTGIANISRKFLHVVCPEGHVTMNFLACDLKSSCWVKDYMLDVSIWGIPSKSACPTHMTLLPPMFACTNGYQHVAYSLVCDHRQDCADASDENFCQFEPCGADRPLKCGNTVQCLPSSMECDGQPQCMDGSDEAFCSHGSFYRVSGTEWVERRPPPPALADFKPGFYPGTHFTFAPLNTSSQSENSPLCPESHFQCSGDGYCLPVFLRCNGVVDCPGREDEAECLDPQCPGFYRCRGSRECLHLSHVCDGTMQCPQQDDELFCDLKCPTGCTCFAHVFFCKTAIPASQFPEMRYLDGRGSNMTLSTFVNNIRLVHLSLADCQMKDLNRVSLPNLLSLDLSDNRLNFLTLKSVRGVPQLRVLSLAGNPLTPLSSTGKQPLLVSMFQHVTHIVHLNLSGCAVELFEGSFSHTLSKLRVLDVRGCAMTEFPRDVFGVMEDLQRVFADNYKLCCPLTLPEGFDPKGCVAPFDEISSCDTLLRSDLYRAILSAFSVMALVGNLGSLVLRLVVLDVKSKSGNAVFVTHLCVSDFLMGLYLAIIGITDRLYKGTYVWEDNSWRDSMACRVAGFISLLSSEVSVFMICLITLDRFLALRFPLSNLNFGIRLARLLCALTWLAGLVIVVVPLLPVTAHWQFYGHSGICLPLPITRSDFAGHGYAFSVVIVLNFVLFLLIAAGQASIYVSIRANSVTLTDSSRKSQDLAIACRLVSIAVSDFLCWFPVGLLGLLASRGVAIPGEANVAMAILILPLNSVLNPFLYNLNILLERRRRTQEEKLLKHILMNE